MAASNIHAGVTFTAKYFDQGETPFTVTFDSHEAFDNGATARIFLGSTAGNAALNLPTSVALKMFVQNVNVRELHEVQALNREVAHARALSHANILPYFGKAEFDMHAILISPYMKNGNLLKYLDANKGVDCRPFLVQVAKAVEFLHEGNRIHGDIKCENVLISDDGNAAMLADFGLTTLSEKSLSDSKTLTGLRMRNTLAFAAPELVFVPKVRSADGTMKDAPEGKSRETDVYAFAMTVIQAFSRRTPWDRYGSTQIMGKLLEKEMHSRPETMPDNWWNVCVMCCNSEASNRPSMTNVVTTLAPEVSGQQT